MPQELGTIRYVTRDQFQIILLAAETSPRLAPWLGPALQTFWATGCRPAEIVGRSGRQRREPEEGFAAQTNIKEHHGLRARDVLGDNLLFVEGKNTNGGRGRAVALKGRTVVVTDRELYRELERAARAADSPDDHVFGLGPNPAKPNWDGYWKLQRQIRKLRRLLPAQLQAFEARWLRHSWAIHALRAGVDLVSIQRQLGHERLEQTAVYLRFFPTDVQGVVDKFSGWKLGRGDSAGSLRRAEFRTGAPNRRALIRPQRLSSSRGILPSMAQTSANNQARTPAPRNARNGRSLVDYARTRPASPLFGLSRTQARRVADAVMNAYVEGLGVAQAA